MTAFLAHLLVTAAMLMLIAQWVPGIQITGWGSAILGALVFMIVNALIKPVMVILTLPITILTLGLFYLVINGLMFWMMAAFVPGVQIERFSSAFWGAVLMSLLNYLVARITETSQMIH